MKPACRHVVAGIGISLAGCNLYVGGGSAPACDPTAPNTICTIAGTGVMGYSDDHGPALDTMLSWPMDVAVSPAGELWVLDFNNYVVRAIDAQGGMRTVVGTGLLGDSPSGTPALEASLHHNTDLMFDDGYLYLASWQASRVKRVRLSDMMLENFAGVGRRMHYDGDGGPALAASLDLAASLTRDPAGNIVIMDQGNQVIRSVDGSGNIATIAGQCVVDDACSPGVEPIACPGSERLACNPGKCMVGMDDCIPSFAGDGGPRLDARMAQPWGGVATPAGHLAYDHASCLVFADTDNNRIRKVDPSGVITTIAGTGDAGTGGDGGLALDAQLDGPVDLAIGADNSIYFTDVGNNCVRKIDPGGIISTVVGQCRNQLIGYTQSGGGFSGDGGPPLEAVLNGPYGIALDGNRLYVADTYNNRIRVVNLPSP